MDATKPYEIIVFGAMDVTIAYEFILFFGGFLVNAGGFPGLGCTRIRVDPHLSGRAKGWVRLMWG